MRSCSGGMFVEETRVETLSEETEAAAASPSSVASSSSSSSGAAEHYLTRVLTGEPESAASRLADALETLGYHVFGGEPVEARRGARGLAARIGTSNNVLDYPVALSVATKPASAGSARVTFYYRLKHPLLSSGGRQTLTREAEAVVALAALRAGRAACVACGAQASAGSRFCRQCGAPSTRDEPSEFEVLRVTAGTCASFQLTTIGALLFLAATLAAVASWFDWLGRGRAFALAAAALGALGWAGLFAGLRRMYRTLNPTEADADTASPHAAQRAFARRATHEIEARERPVQASPREGTTRLLEETPAREAAETRDLADRR